MRLAKLRWCPLVRKTLPGVAYAFRCLNESLNLTESIALPAPFWMTETMTSTTLEREDSVCHSALCQNVSQVTCSSSSLKPMCNQCAKRRGLAPSKNAVHVNSPTVTE